MKAYFLLISLFSITLFSCSAGTLSMSSLSSTWELGRVYESDVNVTNRENPNRDRFITFNPDGSFNSGGAPYGDLHGSWTITADQTLQIIPKEGREVGNSEWHVTFEKNMMVWKGTFKSGLDRFHLSWTKK